MKGYQEHLNVLCVRRFMLRLPDRTQRDIHSNADRRPPAEDGVGVLLKVLEDEIHSVDFGDVISTFEVLSKSKSNPVSQSSFISACDGLNFDFQF